ncbi:ATP-dependent DNA helicase PIF1-like protein [Tanacetum coccineum]
MKIPYNKSQRQHNQVKDQGDDHDLINFKHVMLDNPFIPYLDLGDVREKKKSQQTLRRASDALDQSYSICCSRGKVKIGGKVDDTVNYAWPFCYAFSGGEYHRVEKKLKESCTSSKDKKLDHELATEIRDMLDSVTPLVKKFRMAGERIKSTNDQRLKLRLIGTRNRDGRQYNLPTASEVAALIVGDFDSTKNKRDIILLQQDGDLKRISELHPQYLAMQYPLFFPYAEDGYRTDIFHYGVTNYDEKNKGTRVTMKEWFSYRVQERENEFSMMLNGRRLFQQFLGNLKSEDRPDVMTRVFKMKLDSLMKDLKERNIFGRVKGAVYTIEFQKKGLPHCHILLWLEPEDKITTTAKIDKYISAEIPNKNEDPELYQIVTDHMMHGPCGADNPSCPCTVDFKCTKKFPKQFNEQTVIDDKGYAIYKRRNDGNTITKSGTDLHNGYAVPYNAGLLRRYQSHINVEWCNQIGSIKYINKGPDRVTAAVDVEEVDEIKDFYYCRYLSAYEAAWPIYGFDIHYRTPPVERLPFHLQDEQSVIFYAT